MHYPCLARCPTPWRRHSQLSRCATIPGTLRSFPLGALDKLSLLPLEDDMKHDPHRSQLRNFLLFIALACSVRVTSVITWAFLFPPLLWQISHNRALLRVFFIDTIIIACVFEHLIYFIFTHFMIQVCGVLPALHTR